MRARWRTQRQGEQTYWRAARKPPTPVTEHMSSWSVACARVCTCTRVSLHSVCVCACLWLCLLLCLYLCPCLSMCRGVLVSWCPCV